MIIKSLARIGALAFLALVGTALLPATSALAACPYVSAGSDTPPLTDAKAQTLTLTEICDKAGVKSTGGATPYHLLSAANTNPTLIATGPRTLYSFTAINTTGTIYYLKFYDQVAAPSTCATDVANVKLNFPIPASASGAGVNINFGPHGVAFAAGLAFCLTGGAADNDTTNAATGVALNGSYK